MLHRAFFRFVSAFCLLLFFAAAVSGSQTLEVSCSFASTGELQPTDWRLMLEFSQPVSALELSRRVKCKFNNSNLSWKIFNIIDHESKESDKPLPPERKVFIIGPQRPGEASGSVVISVAKGLASADNKLTLQNETQLNVKVQKAVSMIGSETFFDSATEKGILIDLTENIKDFNLKKHLRIFPSAGYFTVNRQYYSDRHAYKISGRFITGKKYELRVVGGAVEGEEHVLASSRVEFTGKGPEPQISFTADRSVLELRSRQMVPLSFTSVGNFRCQLMRVPAFFGPALDSLTTFPEADEKRPQDSGSLRIDSETDRAIKDKAAQLDNLMLRFVKQHENLAAFVEKNQLADVKNFLAPGFSSDSQAFLGSDNPDSEYYFSLPLDFRPEPEKGGSVIVRVNEADVAGGQSAARLFQITDYSITYKFSRRELLLWITSIETGRPMADTPVMLITNDGRSVFPGRTSHEGLLKIDETQEYPHITFKDEMPEAAKSKLRISDLIIAAVAGQNDSSFIRLNTNRFYSSAVQQSSPDQSLLLSKRGHVFTERGVYRPGETVFWKATLREYLNKSIVPPAGSKVRVSISNPRSENIYSEEHQINEFGTCSGSVEIKSFMPLGQYNISITAVAGADGSNGAAQAPKRDPQWDFLMNRSPSQTYSNGTSGDGSGETLEAPILTGTGFQVQEFEPPRHFVEVSMSTEKRKVRQIVGRDADQMFLTCKISSKYYTGGPVRHARVQWTAHLTERDSEVSNYPLFHFGNNDIQKELIESGNSMLSKDGDLVVALPISQSVLNGMNSIEISATVLDVDSRPSTIVERFSPEPAFRVGISRLAGGLTQGQEFPIQVIVIDKNANKINNGEVQLEIMRKRWFYTQKRDANGGIFYNWASGWVRSHNARQAIRDGVATFDLILSDGGDYMLRATCNNGSEESVSALSFLVDYSYEGYEDFNKKSRTRSENEVILMPDRSVAAVNDRVRIRYSLPRPCEYALFTRECDDLLSARVVKLDRPQGEFVETMTEECRPNVYVGLLAPATRGGFPVYTSEVDSEYPRTYFGFTSIKVQNSVEAVKIAIAPDKPGELKALPGEIQKLAFVVTDKSNKPARVEVAVCVVDEAILSLTGYVTPVLTALTDFFLPLCVYTGDLRTSLISQDLFKLISTRALTGGDQGAGSIASDLEARKDFRPVAFWHPALLTDENGRFEIEFKLPDSMTSYRIYAVAADNSTGFGSKDRQLVVSRDFYIEPGLPRFLTAGDHADFPVAVHNKSSQAGVASVKIAEAENLAAVIAAGDVQLAPLTNGLVKVSLDADNGAGEAKLLLSGQFNGMTDAIERKLPVNTASTVIQRQKSGHFSKDLQINPEVPTYLASMSRFETEGALSARLNLSTSPWSRLAPSLSYLMRYPYGCVEQTSSGIIPLAALRSMIKDSRLPGYSIDQVDRFLEKGINNLFKMQRSSGGFSYWPSEREGSWWGTQYAVLALTLADKSGYEIDKARLDSALEYINRTLFSSTVANRFDHGILALAAVNLAMNNKLKAADLDTLKDKFAKSGPEGQPLLLWAEALAGETAIEELQGRVAMFKPTDTSVSTGWYFSPVRLDSFVLLTNLAIKADRRQADNFAGRLLDSITDKGYWTSTADTGIALYALSEYFKVASPGNEADVDLTVTTSKGNQQVKVGKSGMVIDLTPEELLASDGLKLVSAGKTLVSWSFEYSYPDQASRSESLNNGFSVEKTFENLNGKKEFRVGDLVKVTVTFEDQFRKDGKYAVLSHFALEDPIPAGFTAINSSLKNDSLPPEASSEDEEYYCDYYDDTYTFYANHQEFRNDRLLAFKNRFWSGRFKLVYYLRAICEGTFRMKPTQASLMYNPEIYGMSAPATIKVLPVE